MAEGDSPSAYSCPWCHTDSDGAGTSCPTCGAPVDVRLRTTTSGWTEMPAIPDMAKIQFGQSTCQIEGLFVPVAEMNLAAGDSVYFGHDALLWQDMDVQLGALSLRKAWSRKRAGFDLVMLEATGPGHIAFSHDNPGELIALSLQAGASVDVREHQLLVATSGVSYDWFNTDVWFETSGDGRDDSSGGMKLLKMGLDLATDSDSDRDSAETEWHYPLGQFMDRFTAGDKPGLLLIQVGGNAFVRDLAEGESILVKPPAFLYKDPTVGMQLHVEYPNASFKFWRSWGNRYLWLRLWGPGRVAVQSSYERLDDPGTQFHSISGHTDQIW